MSKRMATIITIIMMIITSITTTMIVNAINEKERTEQEEQERYNDREKTEAFAEYDEVMKQWNVTVKNVIVRDNEEVLNNTYYYTANEYVNDDEVISKCVIDSFGYYSMDNYDIEIIGEIVKAID
jgi:hypothetical protein